MTCRELAELLADLHEGCCPAEVCQEVERHLQGCPPCHCYVESYRLTIQWTHQLSAMAPPADLLERVRTILARDNSPSDPLGCEPPATA